MNRDEIEKLMKAGFDVAQRNFFDDWLENICWVFLGVCLGWLVRFFTA